MSRASYEAGLENVLDDIQAVTESSGDAPVGFNVTYHVPVRDFGATFEFAWTPILGYKSNVESILIYEVSTVLAAINTTLAIGTDADPDAYVDEIALANVAADATDRIATRPVNLIDIPNAGLPVHLTCARTAGTGIASLAITVRYFL